MGSAGGTAFLQTLKAKADRRPSKEVPGTTSTSPSQSPSLPRRPSAIVQTGLAMMKKTSLVGMFSRKTSGETTSVETMDKMEDDTVPPVSPIFPGGPNIGKKVPLSPNSPPTSYSSTKLLDSQSKSTGMITSKQANSGPSYRKASSNTEISASPKVGTTRKPSKIQGFDSDNNMRERSMSTTSVESVYGRYNHDSQNFQMENPLMLPNSTASPNVSNRTNMPQSSEADVARQQAKRNSLIVSASSHVNQSKLLERRSVRSGHLSMSLSREGMSGGAPIPYDRQAFSNPEDSFDMSSPLPVPKRYQEPMRVAIQKPGSSSQARKTSVSSVDSPATSPVRRPTAGSDVGRRPSETFGTPKSSLRTKRANSKLMHDKGNYSNNVLSNIPDAAGVTTSKLRVTELRAFLDKQEIVLSPVKGQDRAAYLLSRYTPEELTPALFKIFEDVPAGWGGFLPIDQRVKWRQKNPAAPQTLENIDSASLERNLKGLMGETTFVANEQIARFQQLQKQKSQTNPTM